MKKEKAEVIVLTVNIKELIKQIIVDETDYSTLVENNSTAKRNATIFGIFTTLLVATAPIFALYVSALATIFPIGFSTLTGKMCGENLGKITNLAKHYGLTKQQFKALVLTGTLEKILANEKVIELRNKYQSNNKKIEDIEAEISNLSNKIDEAVSKRVYTEAHSTNKEEIKQANEDVANLKERHKLASAKSEQKTNEAKKENDKVMSEIDSMNIFEFLN